MVLNQYLKLRIIELNTGWTLYRNLHVTKYIHLFCWQANPARQEKHSFLTEIEIYLLLKSSNEDHNAHRIFSLGSNQFLSEKYTKKKAFKIF